MVSSIDVETSKDQRIVCLCKQNYVLPSTLKLGYTYLKLKFIFLFNVRGGRCTICELDFSSWHIMVSTHQSRRLGFLTRRVLPLDTFCMKLSQITTRRAKRRAAGFGV
jgi:hypothetical protein